MSLQSLVKDTMLCISSRDTTKDKKCQKRAVTDSSSSFCATTSNNDHDEDEDDDISNSSFSSCLEDDPFDDMAVDFDMDLFLREQMKHREQKKREERTPQGHHLPEQHQPNRWLSSSMRSSSTPNLTTAQTSGNCPPTPPSRPWMKSKSRRTVASATNASPRRAKSSDDVGCSLPSPGTQILRLGGRKIMGMNMGKSPSIRTLEDASEHSRHNDSYRRRAAVGGEVDGPHKTPSRKHLPARWHTRQVLMGSSSTQTHQQRRQDYFFCSRQQALSAHRLQVPPATATATTTTAVSNTLTSTAAGRSTLLGGQGKARSCGQLTVDNGLHLCVFTPIIQSSNMGGSSPTSYASVRSSIRRSHMLTNASVSGRWSNALDDSCHTTGGINTSARHMQSGCDAMDDSSRRLPSVRRRMSSMDDSSHRNGRQSSTRRRRRLSDTDKSPCAKSSIRRGRLSLGKSLSARSMTASFDTTEAEDSETAADTTVAVKGSRFGATIPRSISVVVISAEQGQAEPEDNGDAPCDHARVSTPKNRRANLRRVRSSHHQTMSSPSTLFSPSSLDLRRQLMKQQNKTAQSCGRLPLAGRELPTIDSLDADVEEGEERKEETMQPAKKGSVVAADKTEEVDSEKSAPRLEEDTSKPHGKENSYRTSATEAASLDEVEFEEPRVKDEMPAAPTMKDLAAAPLATTPVDSRPKERRPGLGRLMSWKNQASQNKRRSPFARMMSLRVFSKRRLPEGTDDDNLRASLFPGIVEEAVV